VLLKMNSGLKSCYSIWVGYQTFTSETWKFMKTENGGVVK
jgi:hypothetical protein